MSWPNLTASLNHLRVECDPNATITVPQNNGLTLTGNDQAVDGCYFLGPGAAAGTTSPVLLEGSWQRVMRNTFTGFNASNAEVYLVGASHAVIWHNHFFGNVTDEVFGERNTMSWSRTTPLTGRATDQAHTTSPSTPPCQGTLSPRSQSPRTT